jgi:hypothetical protein
MTPHKLHFWLLTPSSVFSPLLCSVIFCLPSVSSLPEVGSGRTVWRPPPSTVELLHSLLLLCFGVSLPCEQKRFCIRCLGIDVTLYATHCFFSRIRRVPTLRLPAAAPSALPRKPAQRSLAQQMGRLQVSGVMSHYKSPCVVKFEQN